MEKKNHKALHVLIKAFEWGIPSVLFLLMMALLFDRAMTSVTSAFVWTGNEGIFILAVCCIITFLAAKTKVGYGVFLACWIGFFVFTAVYDMGYSPVDEGAHFATINYIVSHKRLPTVSDDINSKELNAANDSLNNITSNKNYEAVQAPLYYLGMAFFGWFIRYMPARLRILRLLSFALVMAGICILKKTIDVLEEWKVYQRGDGVYFLRLLALVAVFSPGYLLRAGRLNNECLLCFLIPLLLYVGVRCLKEGYSARFYWMMSGICFACIMTKNTALYAYAVIGIIALYQRKILKAIIPVLAGVPLMIPWLIFNYRAYGHLTGMSEHIAYVFPIVNPDNHTIDLLDSFLHLIGTSFLGGEDILFTPNVATFVDRVFLVVVAILVVISLRIILAVIRSVRSEGSVILTPEMQVSMICIVLLAATLIMLSAGAIGTRLPSLRGRYFHGSAAALVLLGCANIHSSPKVVRWVLSILTGVLFGAAMYIGIVYMGEQTCIQNKLYASKVDHLEIIDITDEEWTQGISADGRRVCVPSGIDYSSLENRCVKIGEQTRIITGAGQMENQTFLELNLPVSSDGAESNFRMDLGAAVRWKIINEQYRRHSSHLCTEDSTLSQSYLCQGGTELYGMSICVGTYGETIPEVGIDYTITDSEGNMIAQQSAVATDVQDLGWMKFYLEEPVIVGEDTELTVDLSIRLDEEYQISVFYTKKDHYKDGVLAIDGELREKDDLEFEVLVS